MDHKIRAAGAFFASVAVSLTLAFLPLLSLPLPSHAAQAGQIKMDADLISFEEESGVATAEGNVQINNDQLRLFAPYVEYDSYNHQIKANSSTEGSVTFVSGGKKLSGDQLDYNIESGRGTLTQPSGRVENFYLSGDSIEVMPAGDVSRRKIAEEGEDEYAARWKSVTVTTCDELHPHYRLETREVLVVPDERVVIQRPRVYLGDTLIFVSPFDYITPIGEGAKKKKQTIFPKLGYESSKGAGLGIVGPVANWNSGSIQLEVVGWTKGIWEGEAELRQEVTPGLEVYGLVQRKYDKDIDETKWRPSWGLDYERSGWRFLAHWSQRELVSLEKRAGTDSRYEVWRKPELLIASPWYLDGVTSANFRMFATWGQYEDATYGRMPTIERYGAGLQMYGEFGSGRSDFTPFYNTFYWYYGYDDDQRDSQQVLDAVMGVRWKVGKVGLETAYLRRWQWGESPMYWDNYDKREEVYQSINYRFETDKAENWWNVGVRGAYSIDDSELAEMVYKVGYNQHCLAWEVVYRDDRRGDDSWAGLNLTITAYPDNSLRLAGSELFEPLKAPDTLAPELD